MPRPAGPGAKQLLSVGEIRKDQGMEGWGDISFAASLGYKIHKTGTENPRSGAPEGVAGDRV